MAGIVDKIYARELMLYAENESKLYNQLQSIIKNVIRRINNGTYDQKLAPKLWRYWADAANKAYMKEFATSGVNVATRDYMGKEWAAEYIKYIRAGEYNDLLPLKPKAKPRRKNPVKPLKRRVGTSQGAKSRTTGKTPAKRLQKRRAKNTRPGYYPNPRKKFHVAVIKNGITYYYDLTNFTTDKRKAIGFDTKSEANKLKFHFDGPGWRRKFGSAKDKVTVMVIPSA